MFIDWLANKARAREESRKKVVRTDSVLDLAPETMRHADRPGITVRAWVRTVLLQRLMMIILLSGWLGTGFLGVHLAALTYSPLVAYSPVFRLKAVRQAVTYRNVERAGVAMAGLTLLLPMVMRRKLTAVFTPKYVRIRRFFRSRTYECRHVTFAAELYRYAEIEKEREADLQRLTQLRGGKVLFKYPELWRNTRRLVLYHQDQEIPLLNIYSNGQTICARLQWALQEMKGHQ